MGGRVCSSGEPIKTRFEFAVFQHSNDDGGYFAAAGIHENGISAKTVAGDTVSDGVRIFCGEQLLLGITVGLHITDVH